MKEVLKKLFGFESMSENDREAVAILPAVLVFGALCFGVLVVFG